MDRIKLITNHPEFQRCMQGIRQAEVDRIYCLHGFEHSLDVARISYILNLEQNLSYKKDVIYAMALLHDIGRWEEYKNGGSHHESGAVMAEEILLSAGYDEEEQKMICDAIRNHKHNDGETKDLSYLLYKADKLSRKCFDCKVVDQCYWSDDQKNSCITI